MKEYSVIGKSLPRYDAIEKVTGTTNYLDDMTLPKMLYVKVKRSLHPHAKILEININKAKELLGVEAVTVAYDTETTGGDARYAIGIGRNQIKTVHYVGQPIAFVAAITSQIAEEAVNLINVRYEELPAVFDAEEAMSPNCTIIINNKGTINDESCGPAPRSDTYGPNVGYTYTIRKGNPTKGFEQSDFIIENKFTTSMVSHATVENPGVIADANINGNITIWTGTKAAYAAKEGLAKSLRIPSSKITVKVPYMGGSFTQGSPEELLDCVLLSMKTRRPIKLVYTREETFSVSRTRMPFIIYMKDGVTKDGRIVARQIKVIHNAGANAGGSTIPKYCLFGAVGNYKFDNFEAVSYNVATNLVPYGSMRGLGSPEVEWAVETQMDIIAKKLDIEPLKIRLKNIIEEGDVNEMGNKMHSVVAKECLIKAAQAIELDKKLEKGEGTLRIGRGIALGCKPMYITPWSAIVKVNRDGFIEIGVSVTEQGQGIHTIMAMIAAEEFKVSMEKIKVLPNYTDLVPRGGGTSGSRGTFNAGNAVRLACLDAKRQIFDIAAKKFEVKPEELEIVNGEVYSKTLPKKKLSIVDLFISPPIVKGGPIFMDAREGSYWPKGEIIGKATWMGNWEYGYENTERRMYFGYSAQAVEVEVDIETGTVRVLKYIHAADCGKILNLKGVEGQMEGGALQQGIGTALYEKIIQNNGKAINPNLLDYKLPTSLDVPSLNEYKNIILESTPHTDGPYGAKGVGETVITSSAPAIGNAICNATGISLKHIPMTCEDIFFALRALKRD